MVKIRSVAAEIRVVSQAQFQIGAAPQKADNRNKIGAASREVPQKAENRSNFGATSRGGGAEKNAPFNIRKKQRTYEKFEFLAQTPLIITFYCISKLYFFDKCKKVQYFCPKIGYPMHAPIFYLLNIKIGA